MKSAGQIAKEANRRDHKRWERRQRIKYRLALLGVVLWALYGVGMVATICVALVKVVIWIWTA